MALKANIMRQPLFALALLASLVTSGCAAFAVKEPPPGFAVVSDDHHNARMKSGDDVGINIIAFDNVEGGTLGFWSEDLVEKLGRRGYKLTRQTASRSKNGVVGTRFDFDYVPATAEGEQKFYTAILFVSDKHRVVLQMAGEAALVDKYSGQADALAALLKVRGCRGRDVCRGAQPPALETTPAPVETAPEAATPTPAPSEPAPEQPAAPAE
jgi:hypothetical protein